MKTQCTARCSQRVAQQYWAYGRGKKCTARCLQRVSKVFLRIENAMYRTLLATCGSAEMDLLTPYYI